MAHMVNLPMCLWSLSLGDISLYNWSLSNLSQVLHLFIKCTKIITELHNVSIIIHNTKIKQNLSVKCSHKLLLCWWIASFRWRGTFDMLFLIGPLVSAWKTWLHDIISFLKLWFQPVQHELLPLCQLLLLKLTILKVRVDWLLFFSLMVSDA